MFSVRRAPSLRRVFTVGRPMLRETGPTLEADDARATAARPRRRAAPAFRPRLPPLPVRGGGGGSVLGPARPEGTGTPGVVASARAPEHAGVHAREIGAADSLVKPFSMKELAARVRAAARRGIRPQETPRGEAIEVEEL